MKLLRDEELQRLQEYQISPSINGDVCNTVRNADRFSGDRVALSFDELRDNTQIYANVEYVVISIN